MVKSLDSAADCCFCSEIAINRIPDVFADNCSLISRITFSTDNFVVLPSLAPLVEGHVLLLPKNHITSLAQLTCNQKIEFENLLQFVYCKVNDLWSQPIIFEHGVGIGKTGGCGVTHAHLHVVPLSSVNKASLWSLMIQELGDFFSQATFLETLDQLDPNKSYLLIGEDITKISSFAKEGLPSQFMRRLIANTLSLPSWNWRNMSNWAYIESTYYKLKEVA